MRPSLRRLSGLALAGLLLTLGLVASRSEAEPPASSTPTPSVDTAEALRLSYYQYDAGLPLNAALKPLDTTDTSKRFSLAYDSAHDQRVTAILALPKKGVAPYPAVLLMHGSGGNKDTDYIKGASQILTSQGFATISLDAQYRGDRARPGKTGDLQPDSYTVRDAWVQTVIDLRRAVDYLESRPDIDRKRIGYLGFSMGGMLGGVLGGVETRIRCFYLAVPGGGIVNAAKHIDHYPLLKEKFAVKVTPEVLARIEDIANVIDPIYYVGRILPRPLRIIVGKHDEIIPAEMSTAFIEAAQAKETENVMRVDSGHIPPVAILVWDIQSFFRTNLK